MNTMTKRRHALPPIDHPTTRARLLAWTYLDAAFAGQNDAAGGKPASRAPGRYPPLWNHGSYPAFERALTQLRFTDNDAYKTIAERYIDHALEHQPPQTVAIIQLLNHMPNTIHVPADITEAAGYHPAEARRYHRETKH